MLVFILVPRNHLLNDWLLLDLRGLYLACRQHHGNRFDASLSRCSNWKIIDSNGSTVWRTTVALLQVATKRKEPKNITDGK